MEKIEIFSFCEKHFFHFAISTKLNSKSLNFTNEARTRYERKASWFDHE